MQNKIHNQISQKKQKIVSNFYLFSVALYFLLASAHLTNILVNLTAGGNAGTFFEFINASTDRTIVYALNFATILYITLKLRKILPGLLVSTCLLASYFVPIQTVDMITIVLSFVALAWFLTTPKPFSTMHRKKAISIVVVYLISILLILEVLALTCWFSFPFAPKLSDGGACRYLVQLETKAFILTGSLAPILTILFLFSWITKPFTPRCSILKRLHKLFTPDNNINSKNIPTKKTIQLLLIVCPIILSFLVTLYPFTPGLNPNMNSVGVDAKYYEEMLTKSANKDFFSATASFFFEHPDRPLSLLAIYIIKGASGLAASTVTQFFPLILAPLLVFAIYFFMHETNTLSNASLLAAFLAVSSFHILVGMYAFYLSNWMALIVLYLFMGFYFSSLKKKSYLRMATAFLLSIALLFTHSWTWGMSIGVIFAYLLLTIIHHRKNLDASRFETRFLIILILVNVSMCIIRNYGLGLPTGNFETVRIAQNTISIGALESFGKDLFHTFFNTHYGFFVNPMALLLAVLGGFIIVSEDNPVNRYLTSWLLGSSIFFVLCSGWVIKSRILFNIPLPVFGALGLVGITNMVKKVFEPDKTALINRLTITFVIIAGLNYAFRCAFEMAKLA